MNILLRNIQSFKEARYEFPNTGLVQIIGDNSNGKSILMKAISSTATLKIMIDEDRQALIRDTENMADIIMEYKGKGLIVHLERERNNCYMMLVRSEKDKVIRTFRDGGLDMLLYEFGFRVYNKNSLCLQMHDTFGIMPFVNTSMSTNYEIVDSVTTDTIAQNFLTNFKEITHKKAREVIKQYDTKLEGVRKAKSTIIIFDYIAYTDINKKMTKIYNILKYLEPIELKRLKLPPKVSIIDVEAPVLHKIKFIIPIPTAPTVCDLSHILRDMLKIRNGICPTCGKRLLNDINCT